MTRNVMALIILAVLVLIIGSGVSKYLDGRTIQKLRDRETAQQFAARESDKRQAVLMAQLATDSVVRDSLERFNVQLRQQAQTQRVRVVHVRDSVRATIQEDTLSAGLRNLLSIEREVAASFRIERDLERGLREGAEAQVAILTTRQRALRLLLLDLRAQRDSALVLAGDAIAAASPSFFRRLFQDLPRKAACAVGGSIVAEMNDGNVPLGAMIGLGACLLVEGILP